MKVDFYNTKVELFKLRKGEVVASPDLKDIFHIKSVVNTVNSTVLLAVESSSGTQEFRSTELLWVGECV